MTRLIVLFFFLVTIFISCSKKYDVHVGPFDNTADSICIYNNVPGYLAIGNLRLWQSDTIPPNRVIKGIVISDFSNGNFDPKKLALQDSTGGIIVKFQNTHNVTWGSFVQINVSNKALSESDGVLEVSNIFPADVIYFGTCVQNPLTATITQIKDTLDAFESRLVKINNVIRTGSDTATYEQNNEVTDGTDTIIVYTLSTASFADDTFPADSLKFVQGIILEFNGTPRLLMRDLKDKLKN